VHGAAADGGAGFEHARMGIEPFEGGQKRGVDVEMAIEPARDKVLRVQPHEACIAEKLDARIVERLCERGVEGLA
jgi:hypothetical protein